MIWRQYSIDPIEGKRKQRYLGDHTDLLNLIAEDNLTLHKSPPVSIGHTNQRNNWDMKC
jgi:hypothetical protein